MLNRLVPISLLLLPVAACDSSPVANVTLANGPIVACNGALKFEIPSGYKRVDNIDSTISVFSGGSPDLQLNINIRWLTGDDLPEDVSEVMLRMTAEDYDLKLYERDNLIYFVESETEKNDGTPTSVTTWQVAIKDVLLIFTGPAVPEADASPPPFSDVVEFAIDSLQYDPKMAR